jgi:1-acyl-sn-glycerol-3-phosphate acyltransferase
MALFRRFYRLVLLILHILHGIILAILYAQPDEEGRVPERFRGIAFRWHQRTLKILNLDARYFGASPNTTVLVVSNHISWLDIIVLAQAFPVDFLSKSEVRSWPFYGWLAARGGTLFIERGNQHGADHAIEQITNNLRHRDNVLIFPEGTTTDGNGLRKFHARLFAAAQRADTPIQPMALRYPGPGGKTHPAVPFIDNDGLLESLWKILGQKSIRVEVHYCPLIALDGKERRELAQEAHDCIQDTLELPEYNRATRGTSRRA